MKEIKLIHGKVALVDDEDFERLSLFKWCADRKRSTYYAIRNILYLDNKQTTISMHREILNAPPAMQVDHINGNGLDNQRNNLRLCTHQQNCFNKNAQKNNKLGIKGVRRRADLKKFQAQIQINGKAIHLGYFNVLGDADSAYRKAEERYFGEFAKAKH